MNEIISFDWPLVKFIAEKTTFEEKGIDWFFTSPENIYTGVKFSIPK